MLGFVGGEFNDVFVMVISISFMSEVSKLIEINVKYH